MQFQITYFYCVGKTLLTQFSGVSSTSQEQVLTSNVWMQLRIAFRLGRATGHPNSNERWNRKTTDKLFVTHLNVFLVVPRHTSPKWKARFVQYYAVTEDEMWPKCIFLPLGFPQR